MAEIKDSITTRVLIVHRYFYPDTPTMATLLKKMVYGMQNDLSRLDILTSMPSYYGSSKVNVPKSEYYGKSHIKRFRLFPEKGRKLSIRLLNSILFGIRVFLYLVFKAGSKYDIVQVATTPPIISALSIVLASKLRSFKVVYHCQDIYPDITIVGKTESKNRYFKILWKIDCWIMNNSWKIVVLSQDMKSHLEQTRKIPEGKIAIVNNFEFNSNNTDESITVPEDIEVLNKPILMFAGNIGLFQEMEFVCRAVLEAQTKLDFIFLIIGEGVMKDTLQDKYENENIIFTGYLKNEIVNKVYKIAKAGIAPVVFGIEKVAFPSKIISYTSGGLPVLTFSEKGSAIQQTCENNNFGVNYSYEGIEFLDKMILKIMNNKINRLELSKKSQKKFSEKNAIQSWLKIYELCQS